jgi:hypothetical protein
MKPFPSPAAFLPDAASAVKPIRAFFPLAAPRPLFHNRQQPPERAVSAIHIAMQQVPAEISTAFERRLDRARVPAPQCPDYHKWVRFCFDFCYQYGHLQTVPSAALKEAKSPLDCL